MKETDWWNQLIDRTSSTDIEEKRRNFVFYFISYIGSLVMYIFAFKHIDDELWLLKSLLFSGATFTLINVLVSYFFDDKRIFTYITGVFVFMMMLGLVYTGGHKNTALYWLYPFPFVLFVLLGYRVGIICNVLLVIGSGLMLANQHLIPATYPDEAVSRFLSAFIVTIFLMFVGEFFRHQSHQEMTTLHIDKHLQANTDQLTGLPNRRFLDSVFFKQIHMEPSSNFPLTVVAMDIDNFKKVNDTHGHHLGDDVLKQISGILTSNSRDSDVVARIGGEEFVILFPQTELSRGYILAEKLRRVIEETSLFSDGKTLSITASFGVACALTDMELNAAFKKADAQLYEAKDAGRNQVK